MEETAIPGSQQKGYQEEEEVKGRELLFKGVERKDLENEEKSRSANPSCRAPRR